MNKPIGAHDDSRPIHSGYENRAFAISHADDVGAASFIISDLQQSPSENRRRNSTNYSNSGESVKDAADHVSNSTRNINFYSRDVSKQNDSAAGNRKVREKTSAAGQGRKKNKLSVLMSEVKAALLSNGSPGGEGKGEDTNKYPNGDSTSPKVNGIAKSAEGGEVENGDPPREQWGKKLDFLLSVIGFAVDLGNVWRFPYICYKNGGGAFLIPYTLMLVFLGLPLFYMELALGQFQRCGVINVWDRICPMFSGIGYGICFVATFVGMYYNTIIAISLFYMVASFRSEVPWATCDNEWNSPGCTSLTSYNKSTNYTDPAAWQYYRNKVLSANKSTGIGDLGPPKWELVLCLMAVFVVVYFCLWKGIKSSGKAVWVTATVPYIVLTILLVRGCTLPGAKDGILYYLTPKWHRLKDVNVWLDACAQIFFSLGPGFGTLLALSSYNKFHNNCYLDAILVSIINCMTSFLAGFVVFSVLGYMAHTLGELVEKVATEGPGLMFMVYPEVIATLGGSVFWSIIFFLMLITLGLDSTFGGLEAVITAVCDAYPSLGRKREIVVLVVILYCFLGALSTCTYGGEYVLALLDKHAAPISLVFICFVEAIAVNWFYGVQKFSNDIEAMLGFQPGIYWKVCWAGICPICLLGLFIVTCIDYKPLVLDGYVYPDWATAVGWCVSCTSIVCIPIYMVYKFVVTPGNLKQKIMRMITPSAFPAHARHITQHSEDAGFYDISQNNVYGNTGTVTLPNSTTVESYLPLNVVSNSSHNRQESDIF